MQEAVFSVLLLISRRELRTGSAPMEKMPAAIIVSFGVTAHWSP